MATLHRCQTCGQISGFISKTFQEDLTSSHSLYTPPFLKTKALILHLFYLFQESFSFSALSLYNQLSLSNLKQFGVSILVFRTVFPLSDRIHFDQLISLFIHFPNLELIRIIFPPSVLGNRKSWKPALSNITFWYNGSDGRASSYCLTTLLSVLFNSIATSHMTVEHLKCDQGN